jgi:tetratricopeptide (TPR) repeat protein
MSADLSVAWEHYWRGDLERVARFCNAALVVNPDQHDALYLLGLVALQRGDPRLAATLIRRAIAVRPDEADYHVGLAEAYWALGELDRTVSSCREALRLRPESPEILCNLGATLVDQGDIDSAIGYFREALRFRPNFPAAHNNLGNALRLSGDTPAALEHLRAAVRLDPNAAEAQSNLAKLLLEQGEAREALHHGREAVRLRPTLDTAHVILGNVLQALGRLDEAESCFREAVRLRPTQAAAYAGLAGVLEQLGDGRQAIAMLREALRRDPRHAGALARLATRLRNTLPEADEAAIERLLADSSLPPDQRWPLLFGLAQVLDARGEFDRAAGNALQANVLQLADFQKRGRGYDPGAHSRFVDQLVAAFTPEFFARVRGWGLETEQPVFVVGMPRSGTTLIEQILASHPRVFGAGELRLAREAFEALPRVTSHAGTLRECLDHLNAETLQVLARQHLDGLMALGGGAVRIVDKMPENTLYLGLIAAMFSRAKIIHCRRDVRDVALSCLTTNFGQVRWACDIDHIASRINEYIRVMDHWSRVLPIQVFEVDYEDVVADLEGVSRKLVAWCGLEWDAGCLEFHKTRRAVQTASAAQVRQPIYHRSVDRWKHYERSLKPLFAKLERAH